MREYVAFLNGLAKGHAEIDLDAIEAFWIDRVHEFFAGKPFKIKLDASQSLRTVVRDVIEQAEERQKTTPGMYYAGAVLAASGRSQARLRSWQGAVRTQQLFDGGRSWRTGRGFLARGRGDPCHDVAGRRQ